MHVSSTILSLLAAAVLSTWCLPPQMAAAEPAQPRYVQAQGAAGAPKLVPGKWGLLRVVIANPADHPVELLASSYFDGESHVQYARSIWVPAHARRSAWYPVLTPALISKDQSQVDVKSLLIDRTTTQEKNSQERVIDVPTGGVLHSGSLNLQHERPVTGLIADDDAEARMLIDVARQSRNLASPVLSLAGDPLPPSWESLDAFDQLVIASDRVLDDPLGLIAIRRWVEDGGRLWIMLDKVTPDTPSALLGDAFGCQLVDRTSLVDLQVKDVRKTVKHEDGPLLHFDEPVELVRVLATDIPVAYTAAGWPAAFWQPIGRGNVLFTTLGSRGWTRARTTDDPPPIDAQRPLPYVATGPLAALAVDFLQPRSQPAPSPEVWRTYVQEEIGHRIVGRGSIAAVLGSLFLGILACGVWLARRERLAHLAWLGPLLAAASTLLLVGMGYRSRQAVPDTVALAEFAEMAPASSEVRVRGLMGVYSANPQAAPFQANHGGMFAFDSPAHDAQTRRMVSTDLDQWHWENVVLPAGLSVAPFSFSTTLDEPPLATATFDEMGIIGRLDIGPLKDPGDAILLGPAGTNMSVRLETDGSFHAVRQDILADGQFVGADVLDDGQRRRQDVLRQVAPQLGTQTTPRLLLWTSAFDPGFVVASEAHMVENALVSLPLVLTKPAAGTRVTIPSPLITYEATSSPDGSQLSPAYSNADRRWVGPLVRSTQATVRFHLPDTALPLRVEQATLTIRIQAPSRKLEIAGWNGDRQVPLASKTSPVGTFEFDLHPADALAIDAQGGLLLNINVGPHPKEETANVATVGWKIERVSLEVTGVVGEN